MFLLSLSFLRSNSSTIERVSVLDFGANGLDTFDDTKAIQKGIDQLKKRGGGILYFPKGIYMVSNKNMPGKSISVQLWSNIQLLGDGVNNSVIRLMPDQPPYTVLLFLSQVKNVKLSGLTLDGNYNNQPNPRAPSEHLHGLYIEKSSDVNIDSCKFIASGGDGIYIRMGLAESQPINIVNSVFDDTKRNGITLGSGFRNVRIAGCYFGKKISRSPIDTEPTGGMCGDLIIENNTIETNNILTLGGVSKSNLGFNQILRNNKLINCSVFLIYGRNIIIENNEITNNTNKKPAITVIRTNNNIKISGNKLKINNQSAISITYSANQYPSSIDIIGNQIAFNVESSPCFFIRGGDDLRIADNTITTTGKSRLFMNITATRTMKGLSFLNNEVGDFRQNFLVSFREKHTIDSFILRNNKFANKRVFLQAIRADKRLVNFKIDNE